MARNRFFALLLVGIASAGCPSSSGGRADASASDAPTSSGDGGAVDASDVAPYRHTVVIDGTNDFAVGDTFATTSVGYAAYVSWDDDNLYLGYAGPDVATDAADSDSKWVLIYIDTDPRGSAGTASGETYNTQTPGFPTGFAADYYYRWKSDDTFEDLQTFNSGWSPTGASVDAAVSGSFMEVAVPLTELGSPAEVSLVGLMLNEKPLGEAAYAGLYADAFIDGYHSTIPIAHFLQADFAAARNPADPANQSR